MLPNFSANLITPQTTLCSGWGQEGSKKQNYLDGLFSYGHTNIRKWWGRFVETESRTLEYHVWRNWWSSPLWLWASVDPPTLIFENHFRILEGQSSVTPQYSMWGRKLSDSWRTVGIEWPWSLKVTLEPDIQGKRRVSLHVPRGSSQNRETAKSVAHTHGFVFFTGRWRRCRFAVSIPLL